ncbi:MAG: hypothetical protein QMD17_03745 [Rhodocyclaceae bacterium]|jgi:hypothetical protein|nr:hypothetical protein [Rhodocyclaceae bacterium]
MVDRAFIFLFSMLVATHAAGVLDDREQTTLHQQAAELRNSAKNQRADAEKRFTAEERLCMGRFLVTSCIDDAKKAKQQSLRAVKQAEQEARSIERQIKANEREMKAARRLEEAPQREAEAARRAEKSQRDYEAASQRVERKQAGR